ncbi:MAG: hypothetical protein Q7J68_07165 [Thermoplasmata archaeon]|nr:hypothetical protein [Thermoplasmata archaeon]
MEKPSFKNLAIALTICLSLGALTMFAPVFPCGYKDAASGATAGYGYHSLAKVASEGFQWDSASVPEPYVMYTGTGPYVVNANTWIALLYIPIILAIIYFGWFIISTEGQIFNFIRPSKR